MSLAGNQRGSALILVLVLLSVLSVVAIESLRRAQIEMESAGAYMGGVQGRELCESGLRLAALLLERDLDDNDYDSLADVWATFFQQNDPDESLRFSTGELRVEISPENGRLPVNALASETGRQAMLRLLVSEPFDMPREEAELLVEAMRDWIDEDEEGRLERPAYEAQGLGYRPRNGPMASLDELLLVQGMARELYFGNEERPGLRDLLTVHGEGKVNINTAPGLVLMALCPEEVGQAAAAALARDMLAFREDSANADLLNTAEWYRTAMHGHERVVLPETLVSVRSNVFRVRVTATAGAVTRSLEAVLLRTPGQPQAQPGGPVPRVALERKVLG